MCLQGVPKWGVFWEFSPHNPVFFSERPKDRLWQACWDCPYLHYLPPILRPQSSAAPPPMCNHVTQCVIMLLRRVAIYHREGGGGRREGGKGGGQRSGRNQEVHFDAEESLAGKLTALTTKVHRAHHTTRAVSIKRVSKAFSGATICRLSRNSSPQTGGLAGVWLFEEPKRVNTRFSGVTPSFRLLKKALLVALIEVSNGAMAF